MRVCVCVCVCVRACVCVCVRACVFCVLERETHRGKASEKEKGVVVEGKRVCNFIFI